MAGGFGLDHGEWQAIIAPQHVVDETLARAGLHAGNGVFGDVRCVGFPAGFAQQQIDEMVAGLGFGVIVGVRQGGVGCARGGDFGLEALYFRVQRRVAGFGGCEFVVALARQFGFAPAKLLQRQFCYVRDGLWEFGGVEC